MLATSLVLLLLPAGASAFSGAAKVGRKILVTSDPGEKNRIDVGFELDPFQWSISDSEGMISTLPCFAASPNTALCPVTGDDRLEVRPGDGDDLVGLTPLIGLTFPGRQAVSVFAGGGDDQVLSAGQGPIRAFGGVGSDRLLSSFGDDIFSGGPGDDLLQPGGGRDSVKGGPGADRIRARDFTRDLRIDCGSGRDSLQRDAFDPPAAGCP